MNVVGSSESYAKQNQDDNVVDFENEEFRELLDSQVQLMRRASSIVDDTFHISQRDKERMCQQLLELDVEYDVALFALKSVQYESVATAMHFICEKNQSGFFEHPFMGLGRDQEICRMCYCEKSQHQAEEPGQTSLIRRGTLTSSYDRGGAKNDLESGPLLTRNFTINPQNFNLVGQEMVRQRSKMIQIDGEDESGDNQNSDLLCDICYLTKPISEFFKFNCGHTFCLECVREQFQYHISRADLRQLICSFPNCGEKVTNEQLHTIFKEQPEILSKYQIFEEKVALDSDPLVRYCPKVGCDGWTRAKDFKAKKLACPQCKTNICFMCRDEWHGYCTSCNRNSELKFNDWAREKNNIGYCPKCRTKVEKIEGCNHMTCFICRFQWCWICGGTYTSDHFLAFNPLGCPGGQYSEGGRSWWLRLLISIGILLGGLLLLPILLVFLIPCTGCYICCGVTLQKMRGGFNFLNLLILLMLGLLGFALGMALNAIVVPIFLVLLIPTILGYFIYMRHQAHREADQRLKDIIEGRTQLHED